MILVGFLGAVIGVLLGLAICYYKQIKSAVQNKDKISAGLNLVQAGANFLEQFGIKL